MGYFEGLTANLLRPGSDGRTYYAPLGRFGPVFLVPDESTAARLKRAWRIFYVVFFASIPVFILLVGPEWIATAGWRLLLPIPVVYLIACGFGLAVAARLPRAPIAHQDLPTPSAEELRHRYAAVAGRRTAKFLFAASLVMTIMGAIAALVSGQVIHWLGMIFFAVCTYNAYRVIKRAS